MPRSESETITRPGIEPERFLKSYRDIADKRLISEETKADWKAEVEKAKAIGINVQALKWVDKLRKMRPAEAQDVVRKMILYLHYLGENFLAQEDFTQTSTTGLTETVMKTHALWEAGQEGYRAGKSGVPADDNPYTPGSEEHQRWAIEWRDGLADRAPPPPKGEAGEGAA